MIQDHTCIVFNLEVQASLFVVIKNVFITHEGVVVSRYFVKKMLVR